MGYSGPWRKLIHEKNIKSKISWHCPFKLPFACTKLYILEVADSSRLSLLMETISHVYEFTGPLPHPPTHTLASVMYVYVRAEVGDFIRNAAKMFSFDPIPTRTKKAWSSSTCLLYGKTIHVEEYQF
jgi:hypothetical protein